MRDGPSGGENQAADSGLQFFHCTSFSRDQSNEHRNQSVPQHQRENVGGRGAESHSDSEFASSLINHVCQSVRW